MCVYVPSRLLKPEKSTRTESAWVKLGENNNKDKYKGNDKTKHEREKNASKIQIDTKRKFKVHK